MKKFKLKDNFRLRKNSGLDFNRNRNKHFFSTAKPWIFLTIQIIAVIALAFTLAYSFFCAVSISGVSMEPTLYAKDRVLINRASNLFKYKRGDVVAFSTIVGGAHSTNVKRIVGIPGDEIIIKDGVLYVNGNKEETNSETDPIIEPGTAKYSITLNKGQFFLMGDNRNNSEDSRYESIGIISADNIHGKIWICISFPNFGRIRKL